MNKSKENRQGTNNASKEPEQAWSHRQTSAVYRVFPDSATNKKRRKTGDNGRHGALDHTEASKRHQHKGLRGIRNRENEKRLPFMKKTGESFLY